MPHILYSVGLMPRLFSSLKSGNS